MSDFLLYLKLGWEHIISFDALDHQLFILALVAVYSYTDWKKILILVTAFTIGHSITLVLSVLDVFRIPTEWVEFLIPLTIALTAADNILMRNHQTNLIKMNYFLALGFGLIHGMGFANTVRMMIASEQEIALPLVGFNVGLELGQIIVVAIIMVVLYLFSTFLKLKRTYWIVGVSVVALVWSLYISFTRIPF